MQNPNSYEANILGIVYFFPSRLFKTQSSRIIRTLLYAHKQAAIAIAGLLPRSSRSMANCNLSYASGDRLSLDVYTVANSFIQVNDHQKRYSSIGYTY